MESSRGLLLRVLLRGSECFTGYSPSNSTKPGLEFCEVGLTYLNTMLLEKKDNLCGLDFVRLDMDLGTRTVFS